ncbi:FAD-dependent oxidoreductase [Tropicimonas sp. TH_r6]|uniref:FAD-dependent oxidoreductase n=1 Tax=Tropicimonas sp. TH_r6 TaxID=3082085 RepID=UPI00295340ED|nr:FAD-dependent oxidoreductase [Tropicimonas sp. TH_r6]MDV7144367.1 FAD-dependent oxidoreductase [Tropicimonas sp. TH_r6]
MQSSQTQEIVLVGGGHAHALLLRDWAEAPLDGARLTLINPGPVAAYSGMLPGHIAGHYPRDAIEIDLTHLAAQAGARLVDGTAVEFDRECVRLADGQEIRHDRLSLDIGIHTGLPDLPGFAEHAVPAKPLGGFASAWEAWLARLERGEVAPEIAVIGAGIAGVELALAMQHRTTRMQMPAAVTLLDAGKALATSPPAARRKLLARLDKAGIALLEQSRPSQVTPDGVHLAGGTAVSASLVIGVAGTQPHDWIGRSGQESHEGFLTVDPFLRSLSEPRIFAVGDCAHLGFAPRPKAGVYAVRAAPILFHNLRASLTGAPMRRFHPQADYLKLVSLGGRDALFERNGIVVSGGWVWRWKDRIDQRFMVGLKA